MGDSPKSEFVTTASNEKGITTKTLVSGLLRVALIAIAGCSRAASTGPNGGDVISIKGGTAYAELVSNADTGEMMVQTWDQELKTRRAIEQEPITVGSGDNDVELTPHPIEGDAAGMSSRFYGQADWARGEGVHGSWMQGRGTGDRQEFQSHHGGEAGRMQGRVWEDMGEHGRMGSGQAPGQQGGRCIVRYGLESMSGRHCCDERGDSQTARFICAQFAQTEARHCADEHTHEHDDHPLAGGRNIHIAGGRT